MKPLSHCPTHVRRFARRVGASVVPTEALSDELIARDIVAELERSTLIQPGEAKVEVVNGIVTLTGTLASCAAEKRAYDAAVQTVGVLGVVNCMDVVTPPSL